MVAGNSWPIGRRGSPVAFRGSYGLQKHDREANRAARRIEKQQRLAARRAEKAALKGVNLDEIPEQWRGVARTLQNGGDLNGT